jgi:hypothetical protein
LNLEHGKPHSSYLLSNDFLNGVEVDYNSVN